MTGKGLGMILARTSSGRLRSPPVWPTLKTRSGRLRPIIERTHRSMVVTRLPKPLRNPMWMNSHTNQPASPEHGRDLAGRENAGGHLVEERLEEMVIASVEEGHLHVLRIGQQAGRRHAAEAAADDTIL